MAHTDCSKFNERQGLKVTYIHFGEFKVEGNSDSPLSESAAAHYQTEVNELGRAFHKAVARGRGTTVHNVAENFGRGRCMSAPMAKKFGLIDHIANGPDDALRLSTSPSAIRAARLAAAKERAATESESQRLRRRLAELQRN